MAEYKPGWKVKGIYNEACAAEGPCPYYFGRGVEGGCKYFMVFRIKEGKVNDVDLSGITVIYQGLMQHSSFEECMKWGTDGGIYISDNATPKQREILNTFVTDSIGNFLLRRPFGIKYVKMDIEDDGKNFHIKMPFGEMKQYLTTGADGKSPVVVQNSVLPMLSNVKTCHSPFWRYKDEDYKRSFDYRDRCGIWADFVFEE